MARIFHPKIVTANDLLEGDVIYLAGDNTWSRNHSDAQLIHDPNEAEQKLAFALSQEATIVGPYLADARMNENDKPIPVHFRETFRTTGPSNYPDHGKQAEA